MKDVQPGSALLAEGAGPLPPVVVDRHIRDNRVSDRWYGAEAMTLRNRCLRSAGPAVLAALCLASAAIAASVDVGQPAPALIVTQLDGDRFDLSALRGKVVVLNVWATWCAPCRSEMPLLDAFYRRYRSDGLVLLGLSADDPRDRIDVVQAMRGLAYPAALLLDSEANGFGPPQAVPVTYVVGRDGVVHARLLPKRGGLTERALEAAVLPLLEQDAGSPQL